MTLPDQTPWYAVGDAWTLTQTSWQPERNIYFETIFTQSNGYMGIRGYTEEVNQNVEACREGYLAGVFAHTDKAAAKLTRVDYGWPMLSMISLPELFRCRIVLAGEEFDLSQGTIASFSRTLSLRNGELKREVLWISPRGKTTKLSFRRFLSADNPHLAMQTITITPLDWSGEAMAEVLLDGAIPSYFRCGDRALPHPPQALLLKPRIEDLGSGVGQLEVTTKGTSHKVAITSIFAGATVDRHHQSKTILRQQRVFTVKRGSSETLQHTIAVVTSRDEFKSGNIRTECRQIAEQAASAGYEASLLKSTEIWSDRWDVTDIDIDGAAIDQARVRFSAFSMLQMAPFHNGNMSVPARAYAYNRYHGLYYWDSETFLLPQYLYTSPQVAQHLLSFRHRTLEGARRNAKRLGAPGACFPWMTDSDTGTEQAPWSIGDYVWHQNADIAYAIDQYVETTGDLEFMRTQGLEVLIETSRFWMSRVEEDAEGVVHLRDTVGPDELDKHGRDNGYTSLLARRHLRLAAKWSRELMSSNPDLIAQLSLTVSEIDRWTYAAEHLAVPLVPGLDIPLQDEFLLSKKPLDFTGLTADQAFEMRHTHRVVKQADIIVAMFLLQDEFSREQMKKAYDFYEPMTLHYSSLSYNTHSIIAGKIGRHQQAYDYFTKAAGLDLDDLRGATNDGLHAAALAGTWQTISYGFVGMQLLRDAIAINPRLPDAWRRLRLTLIYRGYRLKLDIDQSSLAIEVEGSQAAVPGELHIGAKTFKLRNGLKIKESLNRETQPTSSAGDLDDVDAVIFDLDGVIVTTDDLHYRAWKSLADAEGIPFSREDNERLRGVSRMQSLEIILEKSSREYSADEKLEMAEKKNAIYRDLLRHLSPADILPGVRKLLVDLRVRGIKTAIGSSSRNAIPILRSIGLDKEFDAISDGSDIQRSKPDPEVFLLAASKLGVAPERCLVVEDAESGVEAGLAAGMKVLAVGSARKHPRATSSAVDLTQIIS